MKLASLKQGRDGRLVVVSNDLAHFADATHIAPTLQAALDEWDRLEPLLRNLATDLDHGVIPRERFHEREAAAPLPRAYQWADGSAYVNHVALVRQARGAEMPDSFWHDPLMYQGGSDAFLGPRDDIPLADESWGCDLEAEVVVVTSDVPQGVSGEDALNLVRLVGITNDVSLRNLIPGELAKGFGFFQSKPASSFSPVFVTPDALGPRWSGGKLRGALEVEVKQAAGQNVSADLVDDETKLLALQGIMRTDPDAALSAVEKLLAGGGSVRLKDRALFVLSQSRNDRALGIIGNVARTNANPDLKQRAIRYLGQSNSPEAINTLTTVYRAENSVDTKKAIISALASSRNSGATAALVTLARGERNAELKTSIVRHLANSNSPEAQGYLINDILK